MNRDYGFTSFQRLMVSGAATVGRMLGHPWWIEDRLASL